MARGMSSRAWFLARIVGCLLLTLARGASGIGRQDLYPHASGNGLSRDASGNLVSAEVALKTPIVLYDKAYSTIFVNGNGVLSFLRPMQRFYNIPFPLDDPVIAPLYTHVDTRASGNIYWVESTAPDVLARSKAVIQNSFKKGKHFQPASVFIVTWMDVGYYDQKSDKVNTYQVAISTNGTYTYVELLYPENDIQWIQAESHPNGLPDAKAQAGFMSEGRIHSLFGSGTDQIQNIDKWSNINRPGHWIFQVGPVEDGQNIKIPDAVDNATNEKIQTCRIGAATCHNKATCIDYDTGYCCSCKEKYFGNGKSCLVNDMPLRVIGKVSGIINNESFEDKDMQCYVQTKDGRTYTALSRIPEDFGPSFQLLTSLGGIIGWLFAKPIGETKNGYELTGGVFNHSIETFFTSIGTSITVRSKFMGLDVFGQLKMDVSITGSIPLVSPNDRVEFTDYEEIFTRTKPGSIRASSSRVFKLIDSDIEYPVTQDQIISYNECRYAPTNPDEDTTKLKFSRGIISYEAQEGIIRFAMNGKTTPLEEEDPCIQGKATCGAHSSCVVEGDDFKCICNPGYQYLYDSSGNATCVDINECIAGNHVCSPNAMCINNEGSHACQCKHGFSGDGRICEKLPTCDETHCLENEMCSMISGYPVCTCIPGYENTDQGCLSAEHASCDVVNNCSPNGLCSYDGNKHMYVCVCAHGYVGNGYQCWSELDGQPPDEIPIPQCLVGVCWCPKDWEYRRGICVRQEEDSMQGSGDGIRDLTAYPLPECNEEYCICPWGYYHAEKFYHSRLEDICVPAPEYEHDTKGPSGSYLSCNVVNWCHPHAQCIYEPNMDEYFCRCSPGYEGDGNECVKTEVSCLDADICDPNASCQHSEIFAKCVCNPGFEGDGKTCHAIDECNDHPDCKENERCSYIPSSARYECTCNPGFTMADGICVASDCSTHPSQCHINGQCVFSSDGSGYKCVCINGYHGDGVNQCIVDTVGCNVLNTCGRNAVCGYNQTSANYVCVCSPGYYGDGFTCVLQTSCKRDPAICSRDASCVAIGNEMYSCVCNDGYFGDGMNCKAKSSDDANFLLVNQGISTHRIPFIPRSKSPGGPIYVSDKQMAVALDIDCANGRMYLSDINNNKITSLNYNGTNVESFLFGVSSPEGISIDWISRNIFWTDSAKGTVEAANIDTKKRIVLINQGLHNPRGIAVHPYRGKLFWSDWRRTDPKLEWSNQDGTERQLFLHGDKVQLPNSLCIDWSSDELCWSDAGTLSINCVNIDSKSVHVVVKDLSYPFGLAISQYHYYWTDWKSHKIEVALKSTGERQKSISVPPGGSGKLYDIVAVPESCPRISNVCQFEHGACTKEQLCLPDGHGGRSCLCADNAVGACTSEFYGS